MRVDETIALAALIQATVCQAVEAVRRQPGIPPVPPGPIMENKWRALRYGIDGKLIDFGKQDGSALQRPDGGVFRVHRRRGSTNWARRDEIDYLHTILDEGTGADRQLRVLARDGDLKQSWITSSRKLKRCSTKRRVRTL